MQTKTMQKLVITLAFWLLALIGMHLFGTAQHGVCPARTIADAESTTNLAAARAADRRPAPVPRC